MPQIAGFRGVLYDPTKVELANVVGTAADPHYIGRLSQPSPASLTTPVDDAAAAPPATVAAWLASGILQRDPGRAVYRYHLSFRNAALGDRVVVRKMLIAAVKLAPWSDGAIRPHESTPAAARDASLRTLTANAAQVEPVLAGYLDAAGEIDRLLRNVENDRPALDVTTADGTAHRVWRMRDAEVLGKLRHLFAPKKLHVLDGHARYEAMVAYRDQLDAKHSLSTYSAGAYGAMTLVNLDDTALVLAARHRVLRGAIARDAALAAARTWFIVEPLAGAARDLERQHKALADTLAHQPAFVAVFAGDPDAWKLTLAPNISPTGEGVQIHRALAKLDPVIVESLFVERALAGTNPVVTTEPDAATALAQVHGGGAALALIMRPLTMEQVKHTTELGQTLPAGSTAFVPPLAHGLVINVIDPDEDLV